LIAYFFLFQLPKGWISMATFYANYKDARRRGTVDDALTFRKITDAALSATTSTTGIQLYPIDVEALKVCISHLAYTGYAAGTAQWTITVEGSASLGSGYVTLATLDPATFAGAAAETELILGGDRVSDILSTATYLRVTATKTGSPGNLTMAAWVVNV
jgi:hypothetical protein